MYLLPLTAPSAQLSIILLWHIDTSLLHQSSAVVAVCAVLILVKSAGSRKSRARNQWLPGNHWSLGERGSVFCNQLVSGCWTAVPTVKVVIKVIRCCTESLPAIALHWDNFSSGGERSFAVCVTVLSFHTNYTWLLQSADNRNNHKGV